MCTPGMSDYQRMVSKEKWGRDMKQPGSMQGLEELGRVRLSENFFMRDFLYSEISNFFGIPNIPHHPEVAVQAGTQLCEQLLEPLRSAFGHVAIRSAYRSPEVNAYGNKHGHNCASNEANFADHIWDYRDAKGVSARRPASSFPGSRTVTRKKATGKGSPGGFTTTCLTIRSASFPSSGP